MSHQGKEQEVRGQCTSTGSFFLLVNTQNNNLDLTVDLMNAVVHYVPGMIGTVDLESVAP